MGALDLFGMMDNYKKRVVACHEEDDFVIDTCAVSDSAQPYETGIKHPAYRGGKWVIVEMYDTKGAAEAGHKRWVETMTATELPTYLRDMSTAGAKMLGEALGAFPAYDRFERED